MACVVRDEPSIFTGIVLSSLNVTWSLSEAEDACHAKDGSEGSRCCKVNESIHEVVLIVERLEQRHKAVQ